VHTCKGSKAIVRAQQGPRSQEGDPGASKTEAFLARTHLSEEDQGKVPGSSQESRSSGKFMVMKQG